MHKLFSDKGQNTAEYALLIALVVAGVIAMQTYAQRSLQARMRDASHYLAQKTSEAATNAGATMGSTVQYEPYYLQSDYTSNRTTDETVRLDNSASGAGKDSSTNRQRLSGNQTSTYDTTQTVQSGELPKGL